MNTKIIQRKRERKKTNNNKQTTTTKQNTSFIIFQLVHYFHMSFYLKYVIVNCKNNLSFFTHKIYQIIDGTFKKYIFNQKKSTHI